MLVHIKFERDRNIVMANFIEFKPHIGKQVEVARLSDVQGYWYAGTTHFSGVRETLLLSNGDSISSMPQRLKTPKELITL